MGELSKTAGQYIIRELVEEDLNEKFLEILSYVTTTVKLTRTAFTNMFLVIKNQYKVILVVEEISDAGKKLVGTGSLLLEQKFNKGGIAGHIEDVAIHPDHRSIGLGKLLVDRLIETARQSNCYKVTLCCVPELKRVYEKSGMKESGICMRIDL